MVTVDFDFMGEEVRLALVADEYVEGGLAVLLLDATDPHSGMYMTDWGILTTNVSSAAEWCSERGNIVLDGSVPPELINALEAENILSLDGRSATSGMGRYPLATVTEQALENMGGLRETIEETLGVTLDVEAHKPTESLDEICDAKDAEAELSQGDRGEIPSEQERR